MSPKLSFPNPYHQVLKLFNQFQVAYIVIGMSAVNYYAEEPVHVISTADYDVFVQSTPENVFRIFQALKKSDFNQILQSGRGGLKHLRHFSIPICKKICEEKNTLIAEGPYHAIIEILQEISGFTFDAMIRKAVYMRDNELKFKFPVGNLEQLLESKRIADRDKDRLFLRRYKTLFQEF